MFKKIIIALVLVAVLSLGNITNADFDISIDAVDIMSQTENSSGQNPNINCQDMFGATALIRSVNYDYTKVTKQLLDAGADPNIKDIGGASAIHFAAKRGNLTNAELLLEYGADINAVDNEGFTPLMRAAANGNKELAELFAEQGAKINAQNNEGETALIYAVEAKEPELVKDLLTRGASPDISSNDGATALEIALNNRNPQIREIISQYAPKDNIETKVLLVSTGTGNIYQPILSDNRESGKTAAVQDKITVNLGVESTKEEARRKWLSVKILNQDLLEGLKPSIPAVRPGDQSMGYKLLAGEFDDVDDAEDLCEELEENQLECSVETGDFTLMDIPLPWKMEYEGFEKDKSLPWLGSTQYASASNSILDNYQPLMELKEVSIGETDIEDEVIYEDPEGVEIAEMEIEEFQIQEFKPEPKAKTRKKTRKPRSVSSGKAERYVPVQQDSRRYKRNYRKYYKSDYKSYARDYQRKNSKWWLHIDTYEDKISAEKHWQFLKSVYPKILRGTGYKIAEPGRVSKYRLRIGPFANEQDASKKCERLKAQNVYCLTLNE